MYARTVVPKSETLVDIRKSAKLSQEQMAYLLGTSWGTISRWERGKVQSPSADTLERLDRIERLLDEVRGILSAEGFIRFLQTPQAGLAGHRPYDLLSNAYSFEKLLDFIQGSKAGEMS